MDIVVEQIVKKEKNIRTTLTKVLIILILFLIPVAFYGISLLTFEPYFIMVGFFLFVFGIYVAWYLITSLNLEYEYCVTNNDLTIDKIIAKRKRKRIASVEINKIEDFDKLSNMNLSDKKYRKFFFAGDSDNSEELYACVFDTKKYGKTFLTFSPNERVMNSMKPYLKKDIVLKTYYNRSK